MARVKRGRISLSEALFRRNIARRASAADGLLAMNMLLFLLLLLSALSHRIPCHVSQNVSIKLPFVTVLFLLNPSGQNYRKIFGKNRGKNSEKAFPIVLPIGKACIFLYLPFLAQPLSRYLLSRFLHPFQKSAEPKIC